MKNIMLKAFIFFSLFALFTPVAFAASGAKVMVIDFPLNDLTDLPNPLEELARIAYFNVSFKQKLSDEGIVATYIAARCEQVSAIG